jgi:hypothetical protein
VSDIFQEVEEEYRRQQLTDLWNKYRVAIIGGASVVIVGVALFQGWNVWRSSLVETSSRQYEQAAELIATANGPDAQKKRQEAAAVLEKIANEGTSGYSVAAKLQAAALFSDFGDDKRAVEVYDGIVQAGRGDLVLRDYAQIRATLLTVDEKSLEETTKRIGSIAQNSGPWQTIAKELLAYASFRAGKKDEALKLYGEIQKIEGVSNGSKRRAMEMEALINDGLKVSDLKVRKRTGIPDATVLQPGAAPLVPQPSGLAPTPAVPATPTTPAPAPTQPAQPPTP